MHNNNASSFSISGRRESIKALVIDTLPRWEMCIRDSFSSVVEHPPCKRTVVSSNLTSGSIITLSLIHILNTYPRPEENTAPTNAAAMEHSYA